MGAWLGLLDWRVVYMRNGPDPPVTASAAGDCIAHDEFAYERPLITELDKHHLFCFQIIEVLFSERSYLRLRVEDTPKPVRSISTRLSAPY